MTKTAVRVSVQQLFESEFVAKTEGLTRYEHPELTVTFREASLEDEAMSYLEYIANYIVTSNAKLKAGETVAYGYWVTTFRDTGDNLLEAWEYNAEGTDFVRGGSLTLQYWKDQHAVCERFASPFEPPMGDQLTVISKGVFDGLPVQGVRYPSPDNMSGWWITTDEYDGKVTSLQREHTYHLTARRPELAKYLALKPGFRFDFSTHEDVWFEEDVAQG